MPAGWQFEHQVLRDSIHAAFTDNAALGTGSSIQASQNSLAGSQSWLSRETRPHFSRSNTDRPPQINNSQLLPTSTLSLRNTQETASTGLYRNTNSLHSGV